MKHLDYGLLSQNIEIYDETDCKYNTLASTHAGVRPGFSQEGRVSRNCHIKWSKGAKNQPYISSLPCWSLSRSFHIAKSFRPHSSKLQVT